jgi:hypothetical protein
MEEKVEVPVRPVNREEQYLAAILGELRAIHAMLAPPVAEVEHNLFGHEVELKEQKEG